MLNQEESIE